MILFAWLTVDITNALMDKVAVALFAILPPRKWGRRIELALEPLEVE